MKLVFRADANANIGAGHVMRCAAVAEEANTRGIESELVGSITGIPWLTKKVSEGLFTEWTKPEVARNEIHNILIIDSYQIDTKDNFIQPDNWLKTVCFIDQETPFYAANQYVGFLDNLEWPYSKNVRPSLISSSITNNPVRRIHSNNSKLAEDSTLNIVVVGGGTDIAKFAEKVVNILVKIDVSFCCKIFGKVDLLELDSRFEKVNYGDSYESSLSESDIVFTTAGSTVWELCLRKIAFGVACIAKNQAGNYKHLVDNRLALSIGSLNEKNDLRLDESSIWELVSKVELRNKLRANLNNLEIGNGAKQICDLILKS